MSILTNCPVCGGIAAHEDCDCSEEVQAAVHATINALTEGAEFFYTTEHPHQWSSGPNMQSFDMRDGIMRRLESLEQAREAAGRVPSGQYASANHCDVAYGMRIKVDHPGKPKP